MQNMRDEMRNCRNPHQAAGAFFSRLSPEALKDFLLMQHPTSHQPGKLLFSENDETQGIHVVVEGEVKLSINSSDGKRLILRIAKKGEILGLTSALTVAPYEMTAEVLYPAKVALIPRQEFLNFLMHHPEVYQAVTEELSRSYSIACEQLRTVGLSLTASVKLARLLLGWSEQGQQSECGTRLRFSLTHEEIGEFIGASRETVTRTLSDFKHRRLVSFSGSTLTIPNRTALENYAYV